MPTRDPTAPPPLPDLGAPGPLVGTTFTLVLAREAPLTLDELAAVEAAAEATPLRGVDVAGIDGFGAVRVAVTFGFEAVDPGLERLQALPTLLLDLARAVPRAKVRARDPSGLLGWTGARFTLADPTGRPLPGLPEGYAVPASARLRPRPPTPPVAPPGEPELADVLEAVSRGIAPPPRIAVPAARLRALAEGRVLPAAALALMGASAADDPGALLVARALLSDGDAREREAARAVLGEDETAAPTGAPAGALEPGAVTALGRELLARPGLGLPTAADEPDDDLELDDDDLLLDDDLLVEDAAEESGPLDAALEAMRDHPTVAAAAAAADRPDHARRVLDRLTGLGDSVAGACLLFVVGAWSADGIPGLSATLGALARDDARPWSVRALALRALAAAGRPDLEELLRALVADADARVASEAVSMLGGHGGADARAAAREALAVPGTAIAALGAAAQAADAGAFDAAVALAAHLDADVRRALARALPRIGGRRGLEALRLLAQDPDADVRRAAAGSLAQVAPAADVGALLERAPADVASAILEALGAADRTDTWARLLAATRHARAPVRASAAAALGRLGLPAATPTLLTLVGDTNPAVKVAALVALGRAGDRRAVHALRRHAGVGGAIGTAATEALATGASLRKSAPDGRLRLRALADAAPSETATAAVAAVLQEAGFQVAWVSGRALEATGATDPDDLARLDAVRQALAAAAAAAPTLRWSVRDGQYALRRHAGVWLVSGRRGAVARDAGWFDEPLPVPAERVPLSALAARPSGPTPPVGLAPLPVSVMRHVTGRKQVVMAPPPDQSYEPDEITGDVPAQRDPLDPPAELPAEPPDPNEITGETAAARAAAEDAADDDEDAVADDVAAADADADEGGLALDLGAPAEDALPPLPAAPPPPEPPALDEDVDLDDALELDLEPPPAPVAPPEDIEEADTAAVTGAGEPPAEDAPAEPDDQSDWDDLISERLGPAAVERIAARGLDEAGRVRLLTWLGSGLPGIQAAAARLATATREATAASALLPLLDSEDERVSVSAAEALGAIGDPAALHALEAARAGAPPLRAAAEAAIETICGLDGAPAPTPDEE